MNRVKGTVKVGTDKPEFWTASYFVTSCGGVTLEQLKADLEKQSSLS